ncbi:hypothetical protein LWI29_018992 [Acer saccharum]|uniref:Uncharacterized protein n=1 Tax=Acer saccharum TaxID=4024 RepID=A0AA39RW12_ACESA|nr:hypothetical protein LWI29_018992 [Acer saccharum]
MGSWQPMARDTEENKQIGGFDIVGEIKKHSLEGSKLFVDLRSGLLKHKSFRSSKIVSNPSSNDGDGSENPVMEELSSRKNEEDERGGFLGNDGMAPMIKVRSTNFSDDNAKLEFEGMKEGF